MKKIGKKEVAVALTVATMLGTPLASVQHAFAAETSNQSVETESPYAEQLENAINLLNSGLGGDLRSEETYQKLVEGFKAFNAVPNDQYTMIEKSASFQGLLETFVDKLNNLYLSGTEVNFEEFKTTWEKYVPLFTSNELSQIQVDDKSNIRDYARVEINSFTIALVEIASYDYMKSHGGIPSEETVKKTIEYANWYISKYGDDGFSTNKLYEDFRYMKEPIFERYNTELKKSTNFDEQALLQIKADAEELRSIFTPVNSDILKNMVNDGIDFLIEDGIDWVLAYKGNLVISTDLVAKAETEKTQEAVTAAEESFKQLAFGAPAELKARLDVVKAELSAVAEQGKTVEAKTALDKAKETYADADVTKAQALINQLKASSDKTELLNQWKDLNSVVAKLKTDAYQALSKARDIPNEYYLNIAKEKVELLKDTMEAKQLILSELAKVEVKVEERMQALYVQEAEKALSYAERYKKEAYVTKAQEAIDLIKDETKKISFQQRLDKVKDSLSYADAEKAVVNAEKYKSASFINTAINKVNVLPESEKKTEFLQRLNTIQDTLKYADLETAIANAERYKSASYITKAQTLVDALPDGAKKTEYESRLSALQNNAAVAAVEKAVSYAERYKSASYISKAETAISALPEGSVKDAFNARLDVVRNALVSEQIKAAESYVVKAEQNPSSYNLSTAKNKVNALPASSEKDALIARINVAEQKYLVAQAELAVQKWEKSPLATYMRTAKSLVDSMTDGIEKEALKARLGIQ